MTQIPGQRAPASGLPISKIESVLIIELGIGMGIGHFDAGLMNVRIVS